VYKFGRKHVQTPFKLNFINFALKLLQNVCIGFKTLVKTCSVISTFGMVYNYNYSC